jgi:3-oxoacyl-[acyl-carrier protein] reductase
VAITIDLSGQVAVVTGAGAGIGREIATWLARAGAAVVVNDLRPERAGEVAAALVAEGLVARSAPADLRDDGAIDAVLAEALDGFGRLDLAVNNVGMLGGRPAAPFLDTAVDDARWIVEQNLLLAYRCCLAEARLLVDQAQGGSITNVTSGQSKRPALGLAPYGAAKAGVNSLTATLAVELGPHGIRVNAIAPGTTATEEVRAAMSPEHLARVAAATPLGRSCHPDELGRLAVFLASDLARLVTGQVLHADGGAHLGEIPQPTG